MPVPQSARRRRHKPAKPSSSFPLTPHNNGQWCKKIRGKVHFFGVWEDPQAAHNNYLLVAADLHAGRQPRPTVSAGGASVKQVCNHYLTFQAQKLDVGEIAPRWFEDCRRVAESFARSVGPGRLVSDLLPADFEQYRQSVIRHGLNGRGKGLGAHALSRCITVIRSVFRYAYETDLLDKPMKYGKGLEKPSSRARRKARRAAELSDGKRLLSASQIRAMLDAANSSLRAMVLLGINGGFGNADCARLPAGAVDFGRAVMEFDRPKTGVERVVPLWPETAEALRQVLASRPTPADAESADLVFVTTFGHPWLRENVHRTPDNSIEKVVPIDSIRQEFDKLLGRLGLKRRGIGFCTLRHTFRTWADEVRDQHAIHRIMGHTIPGMSGIYVEEISLDRLRAVVNHVRSKLFGTAKTPQPATPTPATAT
ncbi:MAG: tyrosine-type recombinase/integrase [Planctomycetota bacterium]|nr:tyrosine-type recombinase/integrase [Planctomycetota bacterium]